MTTTIHTSANGHSKESLPQTILVEDMPSVNGHAKESRLQATSESQPQVASGQDEPECRGIVCIPSLLDINLPQLARKAVRIFQWSRKVRDVVSEYVSGAVSLR